MSRRLNKTKTVSFSACFETVRVCQRMHTGSVADHSRRLVQRLLNCMCMVHSLSFSF